ncbi:MAG TPA: hypothetical protein VLG15_04935, partial [Thermoanaerobaculia bacterium]|nr:hypothetical protein [Thermoanaerobaculia bacterium]
SISGNELRGAPTKSVFPMAVVPTFSSAAQTVGASFARPNNSAPRFGLILRYQGPQNYYLVSRSSGGSSLVQISRVVNGIETVVGTKSLPNPTTNTFFRLEGQATGTTLTVRVDGVLLLSVVDSTFSAGNVGIGLGNLSSTVQTFRADNFAASGSGSAAPTLTLGATPASVTMNGSSTLTWSTTGATACGFTSGLSGARLVNGTESTGTLTSTTSFGMTCTGSGGSVSKSVTVTVETGPTLALGAAPTNVAENGSSTLTWSTTGADACSFTAGLSGARPVNGSESTGSLTTTTSFGMTCTGPEGTVSKSVTVTVGVQPIPTASEVHASQAMVLPSSVRAFVFLVPNESHHQDVTRLISPTNGYLLPMKVTLPAGATVSVVNADNGHTHSLTVRSDTAQVFATGTLAYGALSPPASLSPGSYTLIDGAYSWIRGEITVGDAPSDGTLLVGAFFTPQNRLADYRSLFPANGFRIESEHVFSYGGKVQVLIIYSTDQDLSQAGPKLQALVKANSYG